MNISSFLYLPEYILPKTSKINAAILSQRQWIEIFFIDLAKDTTDHCHKESKLAFVLARRSWGNIAGAEASYILILPFVLHSFIFLSWVHNRSTF